ncbi:F-box protein [Legionella sp. PATHC035]|nr:F-box protein [Legionella sp. PATHC035]
MDNKFEFLGQLPKDMAIETASHLTTPNLIRLSMVSKGYSTFFEPLLEQRKTVQKFIHHVVRGEYDAVKEMLKKDYRLMVKRDQVTDCSGRTFEFISGFEYALWALDKHMWTMMLDCLPENEQGQQVLLQLLSQYNKVDSEGVIYRLDEKKITEKHFDFANIIIKKLQKLVDSMNAPGNNNYFNDHQWRVCVGGAQKLLPMHIIDEYCSDEPFDPVPKFTSQQKSLRQFYNWTTKEKENWFSVDSKLSVDFAIFKAGAATIGSWVEAAQPHVACNLAAMTELFIVRTKDFLNLKSQLEEQMTIDNNLQEPKISPN